MTVDDISELIKQAETIVREIVGFVPENIEYKIGRKANITLGNCKSERINHFYSLSDYRSYHSTITFSQSIFRGDYDDDMLLSVVVHEILHACFPRDVHGGKWLRYARIINSKYPNLNIKRTVDNDNVSPNYRYEIKCNSCGYSAKRFQKSKVVNSIMRGQKKYICPICKSDKLTIIQL